MRRNHLRASASICGFSLLLCSLPALWAGAVPRPAPPLTIPLAGGSKIPLPSLRGKVVLLKFFLTDCQHCQRTTANAIVPLYNEFRSRGLEVVGVALNTDGAKLIPEFAERFGVPYPLGIGTRDMLTTFADLPVVTRVAVPHLFLIDRRGIIRYEHPGNDQAFYDNDYANLRAELDSLLKEPAPSHKSAPKNK